MQHLFSYFPPLPGPDEKIPADSLLHSAQAYGIISTCENELRAPRRTSIKDLEVFLMEVVTIIVTILLVLCGLAVILAVLFQSGKSAGLSGTIGGVADTFMAKGKAKSFDAKLAKATKWIGAVFILLTLVLNILP